MSVNRKGRKSLLRCDKKPKKKKTGRPFARELIRKAKDELPKIYEIGMTHPDILKALGISANQYTTWNFRHGDDPALKELIAKIDECHEKSMDTFFKWIGHKIVEHMGEGMSLEEMAGYYYTTSKTLQRWIADHDLQDFYDIGKARYEFFWKKMGRDGFEKRMFKTALWQINMKNRWRSFGSGEKWAEQIEVDGNFSIDANAVLSAKATQERILKIQMMELERSGAITINKPDEVKKITDETASSDGKESG
uniref:Uncharacterized protein n=1 Tax=viral metagenome TaxID=1070528 RepID=A0A6M3IL61_9ZZZZ